MRLYHGDCLEIMRGLADASVDAVVTDPPYTAAGGSTNGRSSGADSQFFLFWLSAVMREVQRVTKPDGCGFIFCDWRTIGEIAQAARAPGERQSGGYWSVSQSLVWDREGCGMGTPFRNSFELIAFMRGPNWRSSLPRDIPNVIHHRYPYGRHQHHGAEKPVDLCALLVRWALPDGGTILDPFMGSGTTGVACAQEGRDFIGIERERSYYEIAERRIAAAQPPLFAEVAN